MKISVALCTYNGEDFLEQQLESIFLQTRPVQEIIICDDCSTDGTIQIIQKFLLQFPEIIKLYFNESPLKTIKNFEKAVSLTSGDYIFLCDQDDVWFNNKLEVQLNEILELEDPFSKPLVHFHDLMLINNNDEVINDSFWRIHKIDVMKINFKFLPQILTKVNNQKLF